MIFKLQRNVRHFSFVYTSVAHHIRIDYNDKALYRSILRAIKSIKKMRVRLHNT